MGNPKVILSFLVVCLALSCTSNDKNKKQTSLKGSRIEILSNEVAQYPDSAILVQKLIEAYREQGNYDSAIAVAKRSIVTDTSNAYLFNILATLYFENTDTVNAIHALQKAIEIYPLPEYYVALGTVYAEMKNKDALMIADLLLKNPGEKNHDDAYFIKGMFYNYAGSPQNAIKELDSCLDLNYTYMYAYREKAIALSALNKNDLALKALKRAVTLQNNYDEGYYYMGKIYEKLHQNDSAMQSYQNALLYDNNYSEAKEALDSLQNIKSKQ
ncbi:MAG: tetratricopeptide repeat protein [Chitinophagaceae bacterium]|nr:tetratricopeptide repeat protein [Chitinophagaceae bacterium]